MIQNLTIFCFLKYCEKEWGLMKQTIMLSLCLILLHGCNANHLNQQVNDTYEIQNKYKTEHIDFNIFLITYNEFESLVKDKYSGFILLSRSDCAFSVENFANLVKVLNTDGDFLFDEVLLLETTELDEISKKSFTEQYGVSFVPTTLIMKEGDIIEIVVGLLSIEQISRILKGNEN